MPHSNVTNIPCPVEASQLRRRKALADALAGVVATLVSLWTFYPIDVLKTKLQAGLGNGKGEFSSSSLFSGLFRGITLKTLHAASSSFTYFYLYSFIANWWTHHHGGSSKKMSPAVRLSLSAIAAMMNTLITLPLDVMASKKQAASTPPLEDKINKKTYSNHSSILDETQEESESEGGDIFEGLTLVQQQQQQKMDQVWQTLQQQSNSPEVRDGDIFYDSCSEEQPVCSRMDSFDSREEEKAEERSEDSVDQGHLRVTVTATTTASPTLLTNDNKLLPFEPTNKTRSSTSKTPNKNLPAECSPTRAPSLSKVPSLWKGLYPSLLLCSNPSIHYTVFDMAKSHLLQTRANANLSMGEAFLLGLFAKFCATIATYPLIRAKVMLMVTSRKSMLKTLVENYTRDGIVRGWYKGCSIQLLHTVLKSALLMMVKERIATTTHQLLVPPPSTRRVQQTTTTR